MPTGKYKHISKLQGFKKGNKINLGRKHSIEINKKKGRKGNLNAMSRPEIKEKQKLACQTPERRLKMSIQNRGEKNGNWKGGYEPYYGENWREQKRKILKLQKECIICKSKKGLCVHHKIPFRISKDNSLKNLVVVCRKHHKMLEPKDG